MKVIDLLNKIANKEEVPKRFRYENKTYAYYEAFGGYYEENYQGTYNKKFLSFRNEQWHSVLNTELEIIEEGKDIKEIEVDNSCIVDYDETGKHYITTNKKDKNVYIRKINELVREVNKLKKKGQ